MNEIQDTKLTSGEETLPIDFWKLFMMVRSSAAGNIIILERFKPMPLKISGGVAFSHNGNCSNCN